MYFECNLLSPTFRIATLRTFERVFKDTIDREINYCGMITVKSVENKRNKEHEVTRTCNETQYVKENVSALFD